MRFENAANDLHFPVALSLVCVHNCALRFHLALNANSNVCAKTKLPLRMACECKFSPLCIFFSLPFGWMSRTSLWSVQKCRAQAKKGGKSGAADSYLVTENSGLLPCFCLCSSQKMAEPASRIDVCLHWRKFKNVVLELVYAARFGCCKVGFDPCNFMQLTTIVLSAFMLGLEAQGTKNSTMRLTISVREWLDWLDTLLEEVISS